MDGQVLQVADKAVADFLIEIVVLITLTFVYFFKQDYEIKKELTQLRAELEMSSKKTRFDKHEERIENTNKAVDDVRDSVNKIERHFVGDDEDPRSRGLLEETHELRQDVQDIRQALIQIDEKSEKLELGLEEE